MLIRLVECVELDVLISQVRVGMFNMVILEREDAVLIVLRGHGETI